MQSTGVRRWYNSQSDPPDKSSAHLALPASYKDTGHVGVGPTLRTPFDLNYLFKGLVSKHRHILRYWGLGPQCEFGGHSPGLIRKGGLRDVTHDGKTPAGTTVVAGPGGRKLGQPCHALAFSRGGHDPLSLGAAGGPPVCRLGPPGRARCPSSVASLTAPAAAQLMLLPCCPFCISRCPDEARGHDSMKDLSGPWGLVRVLGEGSADCQTLVFCLFVCCNGLLCAHRPKPLLF